MPQDLEHLQDAADEIDETETDAENSTEADDSTDSESAESSEDEGQESSESAEDEVIISIGDEVVSTPEDEATSKAPAWVKELRKTSRDDKKRIRELEEKLKGAMPASAERIAVPTLKPNLEEFDYDTDAYDTALEAWLDNKKAIVAQKAKAEEEAKKANDAWQDTVKAYTQAKTALKVNDFDEAEENVLQTLSQVQQGIIIQAAENPALVIYALGKNVKKAQELALITDPVKYAFAVAKLETQLKVTSNTKSAPPPERSVKGSGAISSTIDSHLERLRADAAKSGDYSKVAAYKLSKRKT